MSATVQHAAAEVPSRTPQLAETTPVEAVVATSVTNRRLLHRDRVALIGCVLAALAVSVNHSIANGVVAGSLAAVLVVLAATDIEHRIIPNRIVLPATAVVLLARIALSHGSLMYLVAALAAGAFFVLPALVGLQWIGMGDVKLVVLLGAGLGWGVLDATMIAFLAMSPFAVGTLVRGGLAARKAALPLAPFLAFGALIVLIVPGLVGLGGS